MSRQAYHFYRYRARELARVMAVGIQSAEEIRAQLDFPFFCEWVTRGTIEPKVQPAHMEDWNKLILTEKNSQCLIGIAGQNTSIRSPRGSAKSTFCALLTAWLIGVHAKAGMRLPILYISYTVDVASPKSAAIKAVIESREYQRIFPMVRKGRKWGDESWSIDYDHAGIRVVGDEDFTVWCAGLKGGIVSKRCLTGGTMVKTEKGEMPISEIGNHIGIKVLAFDEHQQRTVWRRVRAFDKRPSRSLVEVRTSGGIRVSCTSDHPFYIAGQGYRDACDLVPGQNVITTGKHSLQAQQLSGVWSKNDQKAGGTHLLSLLSSSSQGQSQSLVQGMSAGFHATPIGNKSQTGYGNQRVLLQPQVSRQSQQETSTLPNVQRPDIRDSQRNQCKILSGLSIDSQEPDSPESANRLWALSKNIFASQQKSEILLCKLCQQSSLKANEGGRKQSLQRRNELQQAIHRSTSSDSRERQSCLSGVQCQAVKQSQVNLGNENKFMHSPHQPRPHRQPDRESDYTLPVLPLQSSQHNSAWQIDTVESVRRLDHEEMVYDIEVEDTHNFFANGVLVHNCALIILDDLIKSADDIANPDVREQMDRNWTRAILPVMLPGGRAIHLGNLQRADDIQATRFNEKNGWKVITQSAIVEDDKGNERSYWDFWSLAWLQGLREQDPVGFSFQYQNVIVRSSEISIDPKWIKWGEVPSEASDYEALTIGVDLSSSLKEKADYTVFTLCGRIGNRYYVLDGRRGRWTGNLEKFKHLIELWRDWDCPEIWLRVENVAYQASFAGDFKDYVVNQRGIHAMTCTPVAAKGDKLQRLRGVTGIFENEMLVFNQYRKLKMWETELVNFGSHGHDDCVDSLTYALSGLITSSKLEAL